MKVTIGRLKQILLEAADDDIDLGSIEVGDMVDVDTGWGGVLPVRVVELVDDVRAQTGYVENDPTARPDEHMDQVFQGAGFVGEIDPDSGESGQLVFSLNQVIPGSKAKYYFPKLGAQLQSGDYADWDEYGRDVQNPYRKMAQRQALKHIEPPGSYVHGLDDNLGEAIELLPEEVVRDAKGREYTGERNRIAQALIKFGASGPERAAIMSGQVPIGASALGALRRDGALKPVEKPLKPPVYREPRDPYPAAQKSFQTALRKFAKNWTNFTEEMPDVSPEDAASDAALNFFHENSPEQLMRWRRVLDMDKMMMQSIVTDAVYDAMTSKKRK